MTVHSPSASLQCATADGRRPRRAQEPRREARPA
jgi:hypothetical protein